MVISKRKKHLFFQKRRRGDCGTAYHTIALIKFFEFALRKFGETKNA